MNASKWKTARSKASSLSPPSKLAKTAQKAIATKKDKARKKALSKRSLGPDRLEGTQVREKLHCRFTPPPSPPFRATSRSLGGLPSCPLSLRPFLICAPPTTFSHDVVCLGLCDGDASHRVWLDRGTSLCSPSRIPPVSDTPFTVGSPCHVPMPRCGPSDPQWA